VHFEYFSAVTDSWVETSIYPTGTGLAAYIKDVTERKVAEIRLKELNESLRKQAKELAVSNDELEQFAYAASHDLQEPLRMVTSFMTQLESKYSNVVDERGRKYIYYAVDGAERMKQIILDLLDYSRVGKTGDQWEDVDVNCLMEEVVSLYARQLEELNANVLFEGLPILQTHKTPLRQVFQNLVGNSLKYHRTGEVPVIEVAGVETANDYRFSVSDNGIGISSEYFDKIFIIFQRLHNKNEYSGTGMGLAITKKIIENLGGKIWVESEEGRGSTFYFTLPKQNNA
jgi:light-regulated signal transduction histidine kinase (bacteriophytochrome)